MKRLLETLKRLGTQKEGAFMPFLVIGDPDMETTDKLADALIRAGSDVLEFGFAFSDPPADGPTIQLADQRALAGGVTTDSAFVFLEKLRTRTDVPFALLLYYNLILQYGVDAFYARAAKAGVDAILVADLPIEEADQALAAAEKYNVAPIFIISELTSEARLVRVLEKAKGYLYLVTTLGVTGTRETLESSLGNTIARLQNATVPLLAGFGISQPEHVKNVLESGAAGAIVGSAIIRTIEENLADKPRMVAAVETLARSLKDATKNAF